MARTLLLAHVGLEQNVSVQFVMSLLSNIRSDSCGQTASDRSQTRLVCNQEASMDQPVRVLFLCRDNATRSPIAEGLLRLRGKEDFQVFSAGFAPRELH